MSLTLVYPSPTELNQISQIKGDRLASTRVGFSIFPIRNKNAPYVKWTQKDNYRGLQQARGLDGDPYRVTRQGWREFMEMPGVYGEFERIDETEITLRASFTNPDQPIDIRDLVMDAQDRLLQRRLDRIEQIIWSLLVTGTFSVAGPNGAVMHTGSYTVLTSAGSDWSTPTTATPILDFMTVQILGRGTSTSFGPGATAYMNLQTWHRMIRNTNAGDLGGRLMLATTTTAIQGPDQVQDIFNNFGLPRIVIYDEAYINDAGTTTYFIPDDKVVVIGTRPAGDVIGEYRMVRNANNPGAAPGAYMKVFERGENTVPHSVEVHDGHNGGPVLYFPGAICVMSV